MSLVTSAGRGSVLTHYGTREVEEKYGSQTAGEDGVNRVVEWVFNYDDLPAYSDTGLGYVIPAGAVITASYLDIITTITSDSTTTDLTIGLWQNDNGATYDADGLHTAAVLDEDAIAIVGRQTGTGAVVGAAALTEACQVYITPSAADLATGRARLIVEYTVPQ